MVRSGEKLAAAVGAAEQTLEAAGVRG
jgi:hypothetical protein